MAERKEPRTPQEIEAHNRTVLREKGWTDAEIDQNDSPQKIEEHNRAALKEKGWTDEEIDQHDRDVAGARGKADKGRIYKGTRLKKKTGQSRALRKKARER